MDNTFGNALDLGCWVWCRLLQVAEDIMAWVHLWGRGIECVEELKKLAIDCF